MYLRALQYPTSFIMRHAYLLLMGSWTSQYINSKSLAGRCRSLTESFLPFHRFAERSEPECELNSRQISIKWYFYLHLIYDRFPISSASSTKIHGKTKSKRLNTKNSIIFSFEFLWFHFIVEQAAADRLGMCFNRISSPQSTWIELPKENVFGKETGLFPSKKKMGCSITLRARSANILVCNNDLNKFQFGTHSDFIDLTAFRHQPTLTITLFWFSSHSKMKGNNCCRWWCDVLRVLLHVFALPFATNL